MPKAAVVVFSELDSDHADKARVVNGLQIAREFKEAGDEVKVIEGACAFCAKAFGVKEQLEAAGVPLVSDYKQHPSFRSLVVDGFEVFTL